eukprot:3118039-Rhodomonas_salina.4
MRVLTQCDHEVPRAAVKYDSPSAVSRPSPNLVVTWFCPDTWVSSEDKAHTVTRALTHGHEDRDVEVFGEHLEHGGLLPELVVARGHRVSRVLAAHQVRHGVHDDQLDAVLDDLLWKVFEHCHELCGVRNAGDPIQGHAVLVADLIFGGGAGAPANSLCVAKQRNFVEQNL